MAKLGMAVEVLFVSLSFFVARYGEAWRSTTKEMDMAQFTKKDRQRIIDGYLSETGKNMFVPGEFIDWLSGQSDHEAYPWFFAKSDGEAAREYRISLARQMASGLRISVQDSEAKGSVVNLTVREYPAYVSPASGRKGGGGYERFDPEDAAALAELQRQAATALNSWLRRYEGAVSEGGIDVSPIKEIMTQIEGHVALSA